MKFAFAPRRTRLNRLRTGINHRFAPPELGLCVATRCASRRRGISCRRKAQRFGKFLCAQLDLFLQVGIRFLQPAGHVVELSGERLDLVSRLDGNAPAEVAAAEVRRTGGQRLDRHPPCAGRGTCPPRRRGERAEKDEPGALERSIERRIDSSTGVSTNTSQPSGAQARGLTSFTILRRAKAIGSRHHNEHGLSPSRARLAGRVVDC
jgi:hypothetical protein